MFSPLSISTWGRMRCRATRTPSRHLPLPHYCSGGSGHPDGPSAPVTLLPATGPWRVLDPLLERSPPPPGYPRSYFRPLPKPHACRTPSPAACTRGIRHRARPFWLRAPWGQSSRLAGEHTSTVRSPCGGLTTAFPTGSRFCDSRGHGSFCPPSSPSAQHGTHPQRGPPRTY